MATNNVHNSWSWSSESGIDLFQRRVEVIRATVEAGEISQYSGGNMEISFPGLYAASGFQVDVRKEWLGYGSDESSARELRNLPEFVNYAHIDRIKSDAHSSRATVCVMPISATQTTSFATVLDIEIRNPTDSEGEAGIRDSGQNIGTQNQGGRFPNWNVFDPWRITEASVHAGNSELEEGCGPWVSQKFPKARFDSYRCAWEFPVAPTEHFAAGQQYPRWIGPDKVM
ncbi:MAG: hypothetical protein QM658_01330 [Gordonia sp. (in: high G+C Gram-positive bacteria)]